MLEQPNVPSVIIGVKTMAQLEDNLGAVGWSLNPKQVSVKRLEIDKISKIGKIGRWAGDGVSGPGALPLRDDQQNQPRQREGPGQGREAAQDCWADESISA